MEGIRQNSREGGKCRSGAESKGKKIASVNYMGTQAGILKNVF
jgi:hypothetical protein